MSDTRTYIVPDGQENSTNQMLPWMAMMNGGMGGNAQKLTGYNGADITVSQIPGTGIYLCWFEHSTNTLQLLTGVV